MPSGNEVKGGCGQCIMERMHVGINAHLLAFTENYRQAGLSRHIFELVRHLPGADSEAQFTAFVGNKPLPRGYVGQFGGQLVFSPSRLPTDRAPVRILWEQTALPVAAARARLDLLHCLVNARPFVCGCPVVVTLHDLIFLRYPERFHPAKRVYLEIMTRWSARHAAHLIAVSDATRDDAIELLGVHPQNITTIYNGAGEQFQKLPADEVELFRRQKGVEGRTILYVGTLEPRKNLPTLLHAFHRLAQDERFGDTTLIIGGSKGWYYDEIFSTARELGLAESGRVRFLGRVPEEELPLWYNAASVFAYPSLYEGFGLPAAEAMRCGTLVVVSNTSSMPEVVGDAGIAISPLDADAWADGIGRLLLDGELAARLSERGIKQAMKFSWPRVAGETVALYKRVIERDRRKKGRRAR